MHLLHKIRKRSFVKKHPSFRFQPFIKCDTLNRQKFYCHAIHILNLNEFIFDRHTICRLLGIHDKTLAFGLRICSGYGPFNVMPVVIKSLNTLLPMLECTTFQNPDVISPFAFGFLIVNITMDSWYVVLYL